MAGVRLALVADRPETRQVGAGLFPDSDRRVLPRSDLRPGAPFAGPLFEVLGALSRDSLVGLAVPVLWCSPAGGSGPAAPEPPSPGAVLPVADHVNLELCGPLTGRWPPGVPRDFPGMTGVYQPGLARAAAGARVYSSGVVAAGVADARHLTRFEARAVRGSGAVVLSDTLVPVAIVAAYCGLRLVACGVVRAPDRDRE